MSSAAKSRAEFSHMHVDLSLQQGLACLVYSVGEYRQLSGNRLESDNLRPGVKKRPDRLVSPAELEEIIANSCAQYFLFALYAILHVQDLIDIELKTPMPFSSAAVASYHPFSWRSEERREGKECVSQC